jgi:hypothetical protein
MRCRRRQAFLCLLGGVPLFSTGGPLPIWPTPNDGFFKNQPKGTYLQPTASGKIESAEFGFVRNNGQRFHEGIDIKPVQRNKRNEPTDKVCAVLPGTVAYLNRQPGKSSYGTYVALEHRDGGFRYYSLYAHLFSVSNTLSVGKRVTSGTLLGVMGHSGTLKIPRSRAHLHFEIGIPLGTETSFREWYRAQKYKSRNAHGPWNGFNLLGLDPLDFYRQRQPWPVYFRSLPIAFRAKVGFPGIPSFLKDNPGLMDTPIPSTLGGWEIGFHWTGCPLRWTPLTQDAPPRGQWILTQWDETELRRHGSHRTLRIDPKGHVHVGKTLDKVIKLLFHPSRFQRASNDGPKSVKKWVQMKNDPMGKPQARI